MTDQAETAKVEKPVETITCRVMRDYWDENGERVPAGTVLDLAPFDLIKGMETGIFERVK